MAKLGLVLGGGGVVGISWEIGVLGALHAEGVLDPATAATIIGTSAGSVVGARIAAGQALDVLVKEQTAPPARSGQGAAAAPDMSNVMKIFGKLMTAGEMTTELAKEVGAAAMAAPTGSEDAWVGSFEQLVGLGADGWPDADYRAIALSCTTGQRKAWTKADGVPIARAVSSSCAVPGLFPTVEIQGDRYTDGGAWSASNADLLAGEGHDAVLFVGPISGFLSGTPQVERELAALPARTHAVLPGPDFAGLQTKLMDPAFREQGLEQGRADGRAAAASVRALLGG